MAVRQTNQYVEAEELQIPAAAKPRPAGYESVVRGGSVHLCHSITWVHVTGVQTPVGVSETG